MTTIVHMYGALASHRRARVLQEAIAASPAETLPDDGGVVVMFGEDFQQGDVAEQKRIINWTRSPGRVLLLLPPYKLASCSLPVAWRPERIETPPTGGEGLAKILAPEVDYRLTGSLQTPALAGSTWGNQSICVGSYRVHPAAGLFVVTCLPLWSLTTLDAAQAANAWITDLISLSGQSVAAPADNKPAPLKPDHFGILVFLMSRRFGNNDEALMALGRSTIFKWSPDHARGLIEELTERGLVQNAAPTTEAEDLVMCSPYATYVSALREVSHE